MAPGPVLHGEVLSATNNALCSEIGQVTLSTRSLTRAARNAAIIVPCIAVPLIFLIILFMIWQARRRKRQQVFDAALSPTKANYSFDDAEKAIPPYSPTTAPPKLEVQRLSIICEESAYHQDETWRHSACRHSDGLSHGEGKSSIGDSAILHDLHEESESVARGSEDSKNLTIVSDAERKRAARASVRSSTWSIRLITELEEVCEETRRAVSAPV